MTYSANSGCILHSIFVTMTQHLKSSPRRFLFQLGVVAPGIALAGNLFGCTSAVLGSIPPDLVASSRLDTYYPVRGKDGSMTKR